MLRETESRSRYVEPSQWENTKIRARRVRSNEVKPTNANVLASGLKVLTSSQDSLSRYQDLGRCTAPTDRRKREQQQSKTAEIRSSRQTMSTDEVMKQGRDQALVEAPLGGRKAARTGLVHPAFLPRPRGSKTVDVPCSTLDNLGSDYSTIQHDLLQPSYSFISLLDASSRLVDAAYDEVQRCSDDIECKRGHVTISIMSVVRHGAEELQLSHAGVPTTWIENVTILE